MFVVRKGFTIVELLIVIVVIAILAAITIVAYTGIQERAKISALQSELSSAAKKVESYKSGSSTELYPATLSLAEVTVSDATYVYSSGDNSYCLEKTDGALTYFISSKNAQPTEGYCGADSLSAWWRLNGNLQDSSGNGYNGTNNGATNTTGQNGQGSNAYSFNGTSNYTVMPSIAMLGDSFAVTTWFKTSTTGDRKIFSTGSNKNPIQMWAGGSLRMCVSGCTPGTGTNYADNVWHFAAVTVMDDGAVRMYNDGADTPYLSQPTVTGSIGGDIWLGRDVYSGNFYYGGSLDDVRVYSRSLSVAEIKAIYQRGAL